MSMPSLHLPPNSATARRTPASSPLSLQAILSRHKRLSGFLPERLTLEQISDLLASGFCVKGPSSWGRAAPSAHAWQGVTVFVLLPDAARRYDARAHRLELVQHGDLRSAAGAQDFAADAPVHLVYVVDLDGLEQTHAEEHGVLVGGDAGCIAENIYASCAGTGLGTVVRAPAERQHLAQVLGLTPSQHIEFTQAIGYPAAPRP